MKERIVSFRITDAEYRILKQRAKEKGKTMSEFLRTQMKRSADPYLTVPTEFIHPTTTAVSPNYTVYIQ